MIRASCASISQGFWNDPTKKFAQKLHSHLTTPVISSLQRKKFFSKYASVEHSTDSPQAAKTRFWSVITSTIVAPVFLLGVELSPLSSSPCTDKTLATQDVSRSSTHYQFKKVDDHVWWNDRIAILHFLSWSSEACDLEQSSETQACPIHPSFLKRKVVELFLAQNNGSLYTRLGYGSKYGTYCLFMYATTSAIWNEVMCFKDLKQLHFEVRFECRSRVSKITHRCDKDFLLQNKIITCIFV